MDDGCHARDAAGWCSVKFCVEDVRRGSIQPQSSTGQTGAVIAGSASTDDDVGTMLRQERMCAQVEHTRCNVPGKSGRGREGVRRATSDVSGRGATSQERTHVR